MLHFPIIHSKRLLQALDLGQNDSRPRRNVYLQLDMSAALVWPKQYDASHLHPVLAVVPFHGSGFVRDARVNVVKPAKLLLVAGQHNSVRPRDFNAHAVIGERVRRVEVENEEQAGTLVYDDLVSFVFERNIRLFGPSVRST